MRRRVKIDLTEARLVVRLVLSGQNKGRSIAVAVETGETIYCLTGPDVLHIPPVSLTYHGVTCHTRHYTTTGLASYTAATFNNISHF